MDGMRVRSGGWHEGALRRAAAHAYMHGATGAAGWGTLCWPYLGTLCWLYLGTLCWPYYLLTTVRLLLRVTPHTAFAGLALEPQTQTTVGLIHIY